MLESEIPRLGHLRHNFMRRLDLAQRPRRDSLRWGYFGSQTTGFVEPGYLQLAMRFDEYCHSPLRDVLIVVEYFRVFLQLIRSRSVQITRQTQRNLVSSVRQ